MLNERVDIGTKENNGIDRNQRRAKGVGMRGANGGVRVMMKVGGEIHGKMGS
jgi:hypothetical protein